MTTIKNHWFFNHLSQEAFNALLDEGSIQRTTYPKGALVHLAQTPCSAVDILLNGHIQVEHLDVEGHCLQVTRLKRGATIGSVLLFATESTYPFNVVALEPIELLTVTKTTLIQLFETHPALMLAFLTNLSDQSQMLTKTIHKLSEKTLKQKLLQYLTDEASKQGSSTIYLPLNKTDLAEHLGVARTSLSRELQHMSADGLIQMSGRTLHLLAKD